MTLKITIMGCGNSSGVPASGNFWGDCDPGDPKNRRFRCSVAVHSEATTIVIDTGADFRHQSTLFDIIKLDAVFYSHAHSDHTHGIDDLRPFYFKNAQQMIPCYGSAATMDELEHRFGFMFEGHTHAPLYPAILSAHKFDPSDYGQLLKFRDIEYIPFEMDHESCISIGYRFSDLSYCVDVKRLDQKALNCIKGSRIWIIDGSGYHNHENPAHLDFSALYEYNKIVSAQEVYITSLSPFMDYKRVKNEMPEGFYPAYDGLTFDVDP
ncbi:MAG: MBL fold metallo-hydrolase [Alphaproteobacteria bacterium]